MPLIQKFPLLLMFLLLFALPPTLNAQTQQRFHPFVLAANETGAMTNKIAEVSAALKAQGLEVIAEYEPVANTHIFMVTNSALQQQANQSTTLGESFAVVQRVALTEVAGKVQVAYFNPVYMGHAYRVKDLTALTSLKTALDTALGTTPVGEFGATKGSLNGLSPRQLAKYKYAPGMEYFDDFYDLAKYDSHKQAVQGVLQALSKKQGGASKLYQLDIPDQKRTLFGVSLTENYSSDAKIISIIDKQEYRHTAHFPYEILVDDTRVIALDVRFRVAISWPTLKMAGEVSFLKIIKAPGDTEKALTLAAGGTLQKEENDFDSWE